MEGHRFDSEAEAGENGSGRPVLVVSSDGATLTWGTRWLGRVGFQVETARTVDDALRRVEAGAFGLVLFDDELDRTSAEPFCGRLRGLPAARGVPVLSLCTGTSQALAALESGSTDVVTRPYDWRVLIRRADLLYRSHRIDRIQRSRLEPPGLLTGLPNHAAFRQTLAAAVAKSDRVAVMSIGLDRFRSVNQAHGRDAGDRILRLVAGRLTGSVRSSDRLEDPPSALAHFSGDDFKMMFAGLRRPEHAMTIAKRLHRALSDPYVVDRKELFVSASIGVAISPADGVDAETLLHRAETALETAKRDGGGLVRGCSGPVDDGNERRLLVGRHLRGAIDRGELELHYQPLVNLGSGRVVGAEALLRWHNEKLGSVSPAEFVPLAEESGLIDSIGRWVLATACRQLRAWLDEGLPPIRVSVNVSARQLVSGDLADVVRGVLRDSGIDGRLLELELSERGALRSDPAVLEQMRALKAMGVRLSVDDFGTGNSAIAYLRRFPLDALKIDRSYVRGVESSENDAAITSAMIAMAHKLRLVVVAEGVEQSGQLAFLRDCRCDQYQGFLFSAAVPAASFRELLGDRAMPAELLN
ncbi:MAG TPA: GGDEF domain-containing response regulator [Candidatus Polarisedimenticolaceae bacterium]|nr:GGDEF domain-containing response regulator [Candidatus Polarisedimenticolaceae bacterium]